MCVAQNCIVIYKNISSSHCLFLRLFIYFTYSCFCELCSLEILIVVASVALSTLFSPPIPPRKTKKEFRPFYAALHWRRIFCRCCCCSCCCDVAAANIDHDWPDSLEKWPSRELLVRRLPIVVCLYICYIPLYIYIYVFIQGILSMETIA